MLLSQAGNDHTFKMQTSWTSTLIDSGKQNKNIQFPKYFDSRSHDHEQYNHTYENNPKKVDKKNENELQFKFPINNNSGFSEDYKLIGYVFTEDLLDDTMFNLYERMRFTDFYEYLIKTHNDIYLQLPTRNFKLEDNENIDLITGLENKGKFKVKKYQNINFFRT